MTLQQLVDADVERVRNYQLTSKGEKARDGYRGLYDSRKMSEFQKLGGIDAAGYRVLSVFIEPAYSEVFTFNELREYSGLMQWKAIETIRYLVSNKFLRDVSNRQ